jgi:hypothetical protein
MQAQCNSLHAASINLELQDNSLTNTTLITVTPYPTWFLLYI